MKNKLLKILTLVAIMAIVISCLAACGGGASSKSASGTYGDNPWVLADGVLTISGNADIASADKPENVGWYSVKTSVTKVVFQGTPSAIGDYAFHGMSALTSIELPASVTTIGKCAFAFCSSLQNITLPGESELKEIEKDENGEEKIVTKKLSGVTKIGESAFEGCVSLKKIDLPASTTDLGERAFMYCRSLTDVRIKGDVTNIGKWTFRDCSSLSELAIKNKNNVEFGEDVFIECSKMSVGRVEAYRDAVNITFKYVTVKDNATVEIKESDSTILPTGHAYTFAPSPIEGYSPETKAISGTVEENDFTVIFTYVEGAAVQTPAGDSTGGASTDSAAGTATEPVENSNPMKSTIILIVFGVLIVALVVGVVLFMRSSKKSAAAGNTVRKDGKNSKKK